MKPIALLAAAGVALFIFISPFQAIAGGAAEEEYLVLIDGHDYGTFFDAQNIVKSGGGHALHSFPPDAMIVRMKAELASELRTMPDVSIREDAVDESEVAKLGFGAQAAARAWNILFRGQPSELAEPWPDDVPTPQIDYSDAIPLDRSKLDKSRMVQPLIPHGADSTETSEFMCGSVTVAVITPESSGSGEDWTTAELNNVSFEITQGLNNWMTYEPNASLSFTYVYNNQVPTSYEPIQRPHTDDVLWMQEAMNYLGYTDSNVWTNLYNYANDLRNNHNTHWAYIIFVVDSSNDADGKFSDGWFGYAYLGGPVVVMTYDNDGWGIANMDKVTSHETGHIFWALDEYYGACWSCTQQSGYLWIQNQNCNLTGSGGCGINQACIMRDNNIASRCPYTRGQIGVVDTDGDNIPDVRDTFPETQLNAYSPDPSANPTLTYTGQATVVPLPRPGGTGNDISINTIAAVYYKVDSGSWALATAADGAWDESIEDYTFTVGPLSVGTHTIHAYAVNDVGNADSTPAQDTVEIVEAPSAEFSASPTSGVAPLTVNFSDASTGYVTSWSWSFGDGGTSTQQNPTHTYTSPGTYTVSLTASGGGVQDTETKNNYITVQEPADDDTDDDAADDDTDDDATDDDSGDDDSSGDDDDGGGCGCNL